MVNFIIEGEGQMDFATDMGLVFRALDGLQNRYNWLITDLRWWSAEQGKFKEWDANSREPIWISGEELSNILSNYKLGFDWGVFSAFEKDVRIDIDNLEVEPYADGNPNFWVENPKIQHPKAVIEIVCWDSSCTLFLSKDEEASKKFKEFFPEAKILEEENKRHSLQFKSKS